MFQPEDSDREAGAGAEQEGEADPGAEREHQGSQECPGRNLQLEQEQKWINIWCIVTTNDLIRTRE